MSEIWYDLTIPRSAVIKKDWRHQDCFFQVGEKVELVAECEGSYKIRLKSDSSRIFAIPKEFIHSLGVCIKPPNAGHTVSFAPIATDSTSNNTTAAEDFVPDRLQHAVSIRQQTFHQPTVTSNAQATTAKIVQKTAVPDRKQGFSSRSNATLISADQAGSNSSAPDPSEIIDEYGFKLRLSRMDFSDTDDVFLSIAKQRKKFKKLFKRLGNDSGTYDESTFRNIVMWSRWSAPSDALPVSNQTQTPLSSFFRRISNSPPSELDPRTAKKITKAIHRGVPSELREEVWWQCSHASYKMSHAEIEDGNSSQYEELLNLVNSSASIPSHTDIEKDLYRTFPRNSNFEQEEGIVALRSVLSAYSLRNPSIGYCQSMNFLCALLLLHESELRSFWMLATLLEDILPSNFYDRALCGSRAEQLSFMSVIQWKLPKVHAHFDELRIPVEPLTMSWFMCVFINTIRFDHVLRVWDCLLHQGSVALIRIALVLIKLNEAELTETDEFMNIARILKNPMRISDFNNEESMYGSDDNMKSRVEIDTVLAMAWDEKIFGNSAIFDDYVKQLRSAHLKQITAEVTRIKSMRESYAATSSPSSSYLPNMSNVVSNHSPNTVPDDSYMSESMSFSFSSSSTSTKLPFNRIKPPRPSLHQRIPQPNSPPPSSALSSSSPSSGRQLSNEDEMDERQLFDPRITLRNVRPIQLAPADSGVTAQDDEDEEEDDEETTLEPEPVNTESILGKFGRRGSLMLIMKL